MNFFNRFEKENLLIAHRGYSAKFPENTKIAFENALVYADMIELDITFTKDKKIVVIHDETLTRTSNANDIFKNRDSYFIKDFNYEELLSLDFSAWFDKDISSQKIMLLDEVLALSKKYNIPLNIEIKDMSETPFDEVCVKEIYYTLEKQKMINEVLISSFNHNYLKEIKAIDKSISTAAIFWEILPNNLLEYLKSLGVDSCHIDLSLLDVEKIKLLKRENIFTNVYTINEKEIQNSLYKKGVKAIFSDEDLNYKDERHKRSFIEFI